LPMTFVFQTTMLRNIFEKTRESVKKFCTKAECCDTICEATGVRQEEVLSLARECDAVIVIGDKSSANSKRLYEIAAAVNEETYFVENADELPDLSGKSLVGITAGASTPVSLILEVNQKMFKFEEPETITESEIVTEKAEEESVIPAAEEAAAEPDVPVETVEATAEETIAEPAEPVTEAEAEAAAPVVETFDQLLEKSIKTLHTGDKVVGIIAGITPTEVTVDLGIKQSGYILLAELSEDASKTPDEIVKIGDEIEAFVIRVNDVEGTVQLSHRRIESIKNWESIVDAAKSKAVVEGKVTEVNKGGAVVMVRGTRVFVPASQSGVAKDDDLNSLIGKTVKLEIREVDQKRRRVIGSISGASRQEQKAKAATVWQEIEVGKKYRGTVKSLTDFGAFVDIGGVDGMVHVSELTWQRIRRPSDILKVGDEIDVFVISYDPERKKISFGHKDRDAEPWSVFTSKYKVGDTVNVKVLKNMAYGSFAQVLPGVDGLIHVSQITDHRIGTPSEVLREGDQVDVKITDIDFDKKKISLSIRALMEDRRIQEQTPPENESGEDAIVYDTDHPTEFTAEDENKE